MATRSSVLGWKIPEREEIGGLQSGVAKSWTSLSILNTSKENRWILLKALSSSDD